MDTEVYHITRLPRPLCRIVAAYAHVLWSNAEAVAYHQQKMDELIVGPLMKAIQAKMSCAFSTRQSCYLAFPDLLVGEPKRIWGSWNSGNRTHLVSLVAAQLEQLGFHVCNMTDGVVAKLVF